MTKRVTVYARVSTLDQTVDNQLIELRDHCSKMGVKELKDAGMGATAITDDIRIHFRHILSLYGSGSSVSTLAGTQ